MVKCLSVDEIEPTLSALRMDLPDTLMGSMRLCFLLPPSTPSGHNIGTVVLELHSDTSGTLAVFYLGELVEQAKQVSAIFPVALWFVLLRAILTAFGYQLTITSYSAAEVARYASARTVRERIDTAASKFATTKLGELLAADPSLGMPRRPGGVLGQQVTAQLGALEREIEDALNNPLAGQNPLRLIQRRSYTRYAMEVGAQLSPSDVLSQLGLDPESETDHAELLRVARQASIGLTFTDDQGREHRLYRFGDVPVLADALNDDPKRQRRMHP